MRSDGLNPETLALLAAQLNPQLACDDPAKAIELARNLLLAADPELSKQDDDRDEETQLKAEIQRHNELFPRDELIPLAEAFKASRGHYKTESGFVAALRKEKLTTEAQEVDWAQWRKAESPAQTEKSVTHSEVTSLKAVQELFSRQRKAKQAGDRARKAAPKEKSQKNVAEFQGQKAERNPPKSGTRKQKAEATKQKTEVSEARKSFLKKRADSPC